MPRCLLCCMMCATFFYLDDNGMRRVSISDMMIYWVRHLWNSQSTFFSTNGKRSRLLVYDQQIAQTTKKVKDILQNECKTTLVLALPGATSKVQPLDAAVNSKFKKAVDRLATEAMTRNPDQFRTGTVTASEGGSFLPNGQGKPGKTRYHYSLLCEMWDCLANFRATR